jgi:hypothetical protein
VRLDGNWKCLSVAVMHTVNDRGHLIKTLLYGQGIVNCFPPKMQNFTEIALSMKECRI